MKLFKKPHYTKNEIFSLKSDSHLSKFFGFASMIAFFNNDEKCLFHLKSCFRPLTFYLDVLVM